jgi:peroxiredoxin
MWRIDAMSYSLPISRTIRAATVAGLLAFATAPAIADVKPGDMAPEFKLTDSAGAEVALSSLKGKVVVLEWTNHLCPYVGKHYGTGTMQTLQHDATSEGVVWLTIISSAPGTQGNVTPAEADKLTTDRKASPSHVLFDPEGTVGRAYKASATPHMFVIDKDGKLAYMGAIDDKPSADRATISGARAYAREAITAVVAGKPVAVTSTRAYGCTIKYAPARS